MAIVKKPASKPTVVTAADKFIEGAPDSKVKKTQHVKRGRKVQISLTITNGLLDRIDERAEEMGQSRAAVINLAILQLLESGLQLDKD